MRKFFFIGICLFVFLLSACRSTRQVVQQVSSDSTSVSFREVEKTIVIPSDTVKAALQVKVEKQATDKTGINTDPAFVPQKQTIETKRTLVTIELTKTGELKATAITKPVSEKVTLQEKTIFRTKSEVTQVEVKDSWLKRTATSVYKSVKTILIVALIVAVILAAFKLGFNPISLVKKLFKNS